MSIYPKRVTENENVIIHLKFSSEDKEIRYFHYITKVISPSGKEIVYWENNFIMIPGKESQLSKKEFYYCINSYLLNEAGKYLAKTNLYLDGKVINSQTEENDFFYVDKVTVHNYQNNSSKYSFLLKNEADNFVHIKLIDKYINIYKDIILQPKEELSFTLNKKVFIMYENDMIISVYQNSKNYIKNSEYSWRIVNNDIELFNNETYEITILPNTLAYLWLNCDGINELSDLEKILDIDKDNLESMIHYLEEKNILLST